MAKYEHYEYSGRTFRKRRQDVLNKLRTQHKIKASQVKRITWDKRYKSMPRFKAIVRKKKR